MILTAVLGSSAQAQGLLDDSKLAKPYSDLTTLNGYQPSLLSGEDSARKIYQLLPTSIFETESGCYQRAHYWSYLLNQHYSIKSMKVYLFFTDRYRREFSYDWYFHIAPLIPTVMKDGSIQDLVFDPTFTSPPPRAKPDDLIHYDSRPLTVHEWTRYFIYPNVECKITDNYEEMMENQDLYYCYVMKVPMYQYSPTDFTRDQTVQTLFQHGSGAIGDGWHADWYDPTRKVRTGWRSGDLDNMERGLK